MEIKNDQATIKKPQSKYELYNEYLKALKKVKALDSPLLLSVLTNFLEKIQSITKRTETSVLLVDFFISVFFSSFYLNSFTSSTLAPENISTLLKQSKTIYFDPSDLIFSVLVLTDNIHPNHSSSDLNLGSSLITKSLSDISGKSLNKVKLLTSELGDLGLAAESLKKGASYLIKTKPLTIEKVFTELWGFGHTEGKNSMEAKKNKVNELLRAASPLEAKFLIRILLGNLRIGVATKTVLNAFSEALVIVRNRVDFKIVRFEENNKNNKGNFEKPLNNLFKRFEAFRRDDLKSLFFIFSFFNNSLNLNESSKTSTVFSSDFKSSLSHLIQWSRDIKDFDKKLKDERSEISDQEEFEKSLFLKTTQKLRRMFDEYPDLSFVLLEVMSVPFKALKKNYCTLGVPIMPQLAEPSKSYEEAAKRFLGSPFYVEHKYDGERAQVHFWANKGGSPYSVKIFSRNGEDSTEKWIDLKELFVSVFSCVRKFSENLENLKYESFILDGEVVAIGPLGQILPFQLLSNRKKKPKDLSEIKIPIKFFIFDILFFNGHSICSKSLIERKKQLKDFIGVFDEYIKLCLSNSKGINLKDIIVAKEKKEVKVNKLLSSLKKVKKSLDEEKNSASFEQLQNKEFESSPIHSFLRSYQTASVEEGENILLESLQTEEVQIALKEQMDEALKIKNEGLILKVALREESYYAPGERSQLWRKLKKDYLDKLGDSFDVIVMGAYKGKGKRTDLLGRFLVGVRNEQNGKIESFCRVGTGFSDKDLLQFTESLKDESFKSKPKDYLVGEEVEPDFWVNKEEVWEIAFADLTLSPVHLCGRELLDELKYERDELGGVGIAARFPRFLRKREDKNRKNCSTAEQIVKAYFKQSE